MAAVAQQQQQQPQHHSIQHQLKMTTTSNGMPHGLGLLTTVASLPPKYRSRYLKIETKSEIPLDLSVKPMSPLQQQIDNDVPAATSFTEVYTEPSNSSRSEPESQSSGDEAMRIMAEIEAEANTDIDTEAATTTATLIASVNYDITQSESSHAVSIAAVKPITPPLTPTKRKYTYSAHSRDSNNVEHQRDDDYSDEEDAVFERIVSETYTNPAKLSKSDVHQTTRRDCTPVKPILSADSPPKTVKSQPPPAKSIRNKATRKLKFNEETSSPVSGTIIRPLEDITDGTVQYSNGDIDPKYNIVEITEETKAELAAIKNVIGDYVCKLCRIKFDDAFDLARHRCACIVLVEYRCPECGKQFNCPANLASHRRWHKPKKTNDGGAAPGAATTLAAKKENRNTTNTTAGATKSTTIVSSTMTSTSTTTTVTPSTSTHPKKPGDLTYACSECSKKFKRPAYLRKHQLTHAKDEKKKVAGLVTVTGGVGAKEEIQHNIATTSMASCSSYQSYASSTSASSMHSFNGSNNVHNDEAIVAAYTMVSSGNGGRVGDAVDNGVGGGAGIGGRRSSNYHMSDMDSMSECSTSSVGYGRLQIVESGLTEEENIAAAALTNLRNCASVIQHTTLAH